MIGPFSRGEQALSWQSPGVALTACELGNGTLPVPFQGSRADAKQMRGKRRRKPSGQAARNAAADMLALRRRERGLYRARRWRVVRRMSATGLRESPHFRKFVNKNGSSLPRARWRLVRGKPKGLSTLLPLAHAPLPLAHAPPLPLCLSRLRAIGGCPPCKNKKEQASRPALFLSET